MRNPEHTAASSPASEVQPHRLAPIEPNGQVSPWFRKRSRTVIHQRSDDRDIIASIETQRSGVVDLCVAHFAKVFGVPVSALFPDLTDSLFLMHLQSTDPDR